MALSLLMFLLIAWHRPGVSSKSVQRARECFEKYAEALQQESEGEPKGFWNKEEVARYDVYDWQWGHFTFRRLDPRRLDYKITGAQEEGGYVTLHVEWYLGEEKAGPIQEDQRYFIEEDGRMVGANPILIHTQGWLQKESKHFVYHYKSDKDEPATSLLDRMDQFYDGVVQRLFVDYTDRIDYYKCDSIAEVGRIFGLEPTLARSQVLGGVVASVQPFVPHEVVHIISYRMLPQQTQAIPPEYLSEGLSYYLGGASFFSPELLLSWAKRKIESYEAVRLDSLIRDPWMYGTNEGAGLVCSFAKFLLDTRGIRRFRQLFAAGETFDEQLEALGVIFRKSLDEVQQEWQTAVLDLPLAEVRIDEPINATKLCYIQDEKGDDKGDGDYTYPENDRALPGIFDLTGLKISIDEEMVYFQLEFANLSGAEISSDEAFNGTFAAIALDSNHKENSGNTRLFFDNGNFGFAEQDGCEFAIEVSNAGVLVYDEDWIWQALFLKAFSPQNHVGGNEIYFAVPQKIIGTPDSSWKLQVLVGGQKGGYKNFGRGVGKFLQVGAQASADQGGGGTDTKFDPDVYDILAPEGEDQTRILNSYQAADKRKAIIPMIRLSGE